MIEDIPRADDTMEKQAEHIKMLYHTMGLMIEKLGGHMEITDQQLRETDHVVIRVYDPSTFVTHWQLLD